MTGRTDGQMQTHLQGPLCMYDRTDRDIRTPVGSLSKYMIGQTDGRMQHICILKLMTWGMGSDLDVEEACAPWGCRHRPWVSLSRYVVGTEVGGSKQGDTRSTAQTLRSTGGGR